MNTQQSLQSPIEGALSKILELFMLLFVVKNQVIYNS